MSEELYKRVPSMSQDLIPYHGGQGGGIIQSSFLVPGNWNSRGIGIHISGCTGIPANVPVALVLGVGFLTLCTENGPAWAYPFSALTTANAISMGPISFDIQTPAGPSLMTLQKAEGLSVEYWLTPQYKATMKVYMPRPMAAQQWESTINAAILEDYAGRMTGGIETRE